MYHFIHCSCPCFLLMWCQGFLWACHPAATAPSLIPPSSKCASQVTDGGCLYNVSYSCNFGPARISLQHTHQSTTCASVCSLHISLQHTHQSTTQVSDWSTHISLQPTHQSTAKSIYSIHISIKHTHQSAVYASICSMRMNLQHTHQSTAQRSVYSHTLACSLHTSLQHAHQPTATGGYVCFWSRLIRML